MLTKTKGYFQSKCFVDIRGKVLNSEIEHYGDCKKRRDMNTKEVCLPTDKALFSTKSRGNLIFTEKQLGSVNHKSIIAIVFDDCSDLYFLTVRGRIAVGYLFNFAAGTSKARRNKSISTECGGNKKAQSAYGNCNNLIGSHANRVA